MKPDPKFPGVTVDNAAHTLTLDYATGVYVYGHGQITVCATDLQDLSVDATFAVRSEATAANLAMDAFTVDNAGDFSASYTISGQEAEPFTIGVYGSPGGTSYQPTELLQTYPVTDPSLLAVGGPYTVTFAADPGELDTNCFLVADLDVYNNVRETTKADNVSAPLGGVFQTGDGSLYAFTPVGDADAVNEVLVSQDPTTEDITISVTGMDNNTFSSVSDVTIATPTGDNTIDGAGVSVPLTIYGGAGSDTIYGGDGGDTIYGGAARGNTIWGGDGGNTIYGGAGGGDTIHAGNGGNTIYGGAAGGDTIVGGSGNDTIYGYGTVSNTISDGNGNDTIYAGSGGDTIYAGNGNDQVFGGAGGDDITVGDGNDWVQAGSGDTTITAGNGPDWLFGGAGNDTISGAGVDTIDGGGGQNTLYGGSLYDTFDDGDPSSNDTIHAPGILNQLEYGYSVFQPYDFRRCYYERVNTSECWEAAVYITWNPNTALPSGAASWTHEAWYSIIDGCDGDVVYSQEIDQTQAPSGAVGAFGVRWQLLGNQAFPTGWGDWFVVVSAWNPANPNDNGDGLPMQVCTALVVPVGPTVSVRALVQGSQPAVTPVNQSDYAAWQQSWQPVPIPVEGQGDRTELQLQAAVDQLYSDQTNWQASLEDAPGLDFWTSPTGGTAMTAEEFNGLIASGSYSGDVWVSQDQADAGSPTSPVRFDFQETAGPGYGSALVSTVAAPLAPKYTYVGYGGLNAIGLGSPRIFDNGWGHPNLFPFYCVGGKFTQTSNGAGFDSSVWMWGSPPWPWSDGICNTPAGNPPANVASGSGSFVLYVSDLPPGSYVVTIAYDIFAYTTATAGGASGSVSYRGAGGWATGPTFLVGAAVGWLCSKSSTLDAYISVASQGQSVLVAKYSLNMNQPSGVALSADTLACCSMDVTRLSIQPPS